MSTASETPDDYNRMVRLGEGGFGEVWLAEHEPTGERRALKLLWRIDDGDERDRFAREAHLTRELGYLPYVVQVLAYGVDTPCPWIAYEYIEGVTLANAAPVAHDDRRYLRHAIELSAAVTAVHHGGIATGT
jgi:serine/threonine protein kinase